MPACSSTLRDVAVPAPVAGDIAQVMVLAKSMGLGGRDFTDLVEVMERVAGVQLALPPPPG